jgi:hypothetical protein
MYTPLVLRPISTHEKFPRTENCPKISLLKVENFHFCWPITFYKIFFPRKNFLSENGPLVWSQNKAHRRSTRVTAATP